MQSELGVHAQSHNSLEQNQFERDNYNSKTISADWTSLAAVRRSVLWWRMWSQNGSGVDKTELAPNQLTKFEIWSLNLKLKWLQSYNCISTRWTRPPIGELIIHIGTIFLNASLVWPIKRKCTLISSSSRPASKQNSVDLIHEKMHQNTEVWCLDLDC